VTLHAVDHAEGSGPKAWATFLSARTSDRTDADPDIDTSVLDVAQFLSNSSTGTDARRARLLSATRTMTVGLMAVVPIFLAVLIVLWVFRSTSWSPVVFALVSFGTVVAVGVTVELWRRLGELSNLTSLNEELQYRASHDLLMQVPNRDHLQVELAAALERSVTEETDVGLLFLDLDRFKFVNDSLGHSAGDELLKAVGRRIKNELRSEDAVLARVGGDELVVLMRMVTSPRHLQNVADRLLAKFVDPFTIDGVKLSIGTSIGMAVHTNGESADELYRHADAALYRAKKTGRGRAILADAQLRAKRDMRVRTELALRASLAKGEVEAWFQPEVDLITGEIVAAEALARWRTGDGVEIAGTFIEIARGAGMLEELMCEMAEQIWTWRAASTSTMPVALNVSAAHLTNLLQLRDKDPENRSFEGMRLEIAETDIIKDFDNARELLNQVRELGAQVMLDDFGAGYSSLQMLSDLPIDGIKIDRSYVARVENNERVCSLITSLAEFARSSGMIVVAEGVETAEQAEFLTRIGIDRGQGFLFSRAVETPSFETLVAEGPLGVNYSTRF